MLLPCWFNIWTFSSNGQYCWLVVSPLQWRPCLAVHVAKGSRQILVPVHPGMEEVWARAKGRPPPRTVKLPGATSPLGLTSDPWRALHEGAAPLRWPSTCPSTLIFYFHPTLEGQATVVTEQLKASGDCASRLRGHRPTLVFSAVSLPCVLPLHPATHPTRPRSAFQLSQGFLACRELFLIHLWFLQGVPRGQMGRHKGLC